MLCKCTGQGEHQGSPGWPHTSSSYLILHLPACLPAFCLKCSRPKPSANHPRSPFKQPTFSPADLPGVALHFKVFVTLGAAELEHWGIVAHKRDAMARVNGAACKCQDRVRSTLTIRPTTLLTLLTGKHKMKASPSDGLWHGNWAAKPVWAYGDVILQTATTQRAPKQGAVSTGRGPNNWANKCAWHSPATKPALLDTHPPCPSDLIPKPVNPAHENQRLRLLCLLSPLA